LDALIINQGGKINAVGTASNPIVFTEISETIGSWGGIVILGKAPINIPGGTSSPEFNDALAYGGNEPADNSGTLSYVRIEYAGAGIIEGSVEYNGFGFYAVGSGTTVDNLQTYKGSDDGYEFFGGTVVANNLLSVGDEDDSFDWTEGWTGGGSNWIAVKEGVGDKGIEADNNENDNTLQPMSAPTIKNVTLIGIGIEDGMRLRRGTAGTFENVLITNFSDGIDIRDDQTILNAANGSLKLTDIRFGNVENTVVAQNSSGTDVEVPAGTIQINQSINGANDNFTQGWTKGYNAEIPVAELTGNITADTELDANVAYTLVGSVIVESGATLTIPAGTRITCDKADGLDVLIIDQGAKINAVGTADEPIVFTENSQEIGSWGGIVILGKAPINIPGGTSSPEFSSDLTYGGADASDNSGTLSYVRVEYAGAGIIEGSVEYNGFGLYAVGSGTTINNLETYKGSDDGYEFFGGTVVANNLVSIGDEDDSFDWTEGWTGGGSNWIAIKEGVGDKGIEADNNENDNTLTPMSNPTLINISLVGMGIEDGMRLRRGTAGTFTNVLIDNFSDGIDIRDDQTIANITNNDLSISGKVVNCGETIVGQDSTGSDVDVSVAFANDTNATGADDSFTAGWTRYDAESYGI
ncbi:MAG TPA: hypothetical protein VFM65_04495, partial [Flavobacteriaceae bacterium]|nr:hypothetical protein [Flavobacteriaceae bacterium]